MQRFAGVSGYYLLLLAVLVMGVSNTVRADTITVFAASSLRDALDEIAQGYEVDSGTEVVLVFAASSAVARQVAQGAPADVVLLADQEWADWLVTDGVVADMAPFAGNRLVLIGRGQPPIRDGDIIAAIGNELLAMAQVDAVPAGRYGKAALTSLGLWDGLMPQVVQAANVRAALRFVESGEVGFGIGYASDLIALPALSEVYAFAADTHPAIIYSGAPVTPRGAEFMKFLQSVTAQDTLLRWEFSPLDVAQ